MAQEETEVFLYLGIAHISGVHNFRLAGAIFADSEHVSYNFYIRSSPIHPAAPFFGTFGPLLLYYGNDACQDPLSLFI